jgi:hypothetical protein
MFFSVDVETSHTEPWIGELLSIGAVAVDEYNPDADAAASFYVGIDQGWNLLYGGSHGHWKPGQSTYDWWHSDKVSDQAREIALSGNAPLDVAMQGFADWVRTHTPEGEASYFVANPSTFDWSWISYNFHCAEVTNPFHYRTLCLRSQRYGWLGGRFGQSRDTHESLLPHHALWDAFAQAQDLVDMMDAKRRAKRAGG